MVKGVINKNRPHTSVKTAWKENVQDLVVLVDTGFTGDLKVSKQTAAELGLEVTNTVAVSLGDNSIVDMEASLATVALDGAQETVSVLISPGEPVVGVGLLKKFQCVMNADFRFNSFTIQRCPPPGACSAT